MDFSLCIVLPTFCWNFEAELAGATSQRTKAFSTAHFFLAPQHGMANMKHGPPALMQQKNSDHGFYP